MPTGSLLQDVGGVQNDPLLDEWNNRRAKKLLMRADQAMYSQKRQRLSRSPDLAALLLTMQAT